MELSKRTIRRIKMTLGAALFIVPVIAGPYIAQGPPAGY